MKDNRSRWNVLTNILTQLFVALSGFIIPRFVMAAYGSYMNGMLNSITQFLTYAALVELGVGNAAVVELYRPLVDKNQDEINQILTTAKDKYIRSGFCYTALALLVAVVYPLLVKKQVDYELAFFITLILGANGAIDYFLIGKYKVLLIADQKMYVLNLAKSIATICILVGSVWMLLADMSVTMVKSYAGLLHLAEAYGIAIYTRRNYRQISFSCSQKKKFPQQSSALIHQLCSTIVYNTDLVILTLCLSTADSLKEISVYTVYMLVRGLASNMISTLTNGINATFGQMFAKRDQKGVAESFDKYEFMYMFVLFVVYTCFGMLILSFVSCYTKNIDDAVYVRQELGILFCLAGLTAQLKDASGTIINAAGHYIQSRKYALWEAAVNIFLSLILVKAYGMPGVLVGTIAAHLIMDICIINYTSRILIPGSGLKTLARIGRNTILMIAFVVMWGYNVNLVNSWGAWLLQAVAAGIITVLVYAGVNLLCERDMIRRLR